MGCRTRGIRIPIVIGPIIGIVGAVILGQAAVQARIISPVLVVLVSLSGLALFSVPNYTLGLTRLTKYAMLVAAAVFGVPGIAVLTIALLTKLLSLRSFGVPITAPVLPSLPHSADTALRGPFFDMWRMPQQARPRRAMRHPRRPPAARIAGTEEPPGDKGGHIL